jgi:YesN/AraC family two-component response regulator
MPVNILIAEDERLISLDLQKSLEILGYKILYKAYSAEDAIEYAVKYKPDIILMDIKFDEALTGFEAAYFINSKLDIPIIFISAYSPDKIKKGKPNFFTYSYLTKPVDIADLDREIRLVLGKKFTREILVKKD